jgi:hypothetical protein
MRRSLKSPIHSGNRSRRPRPNRDERAVKSAHNSPRGRRDAVALARGALRICDRRATPPGAQGWLSLRTSSGCADLVSKTAPFASGAALRLQSAVAEEQHEPRTVGAGLLHREEGAASSIPCSVPLINGRDRGRHPHQHVWVGQALFAERWCIGRPKPSFPTSLATPGLSSACSTANSASEASGRA